MNHPGTSLQMYKKFTNSKKFQRYSSRQQRPFASHQLQKRIIHCKHGMVPIYQICIDVKAWTSLDIWYACLQRIMGKVKNPPLQASKGQCAVFDRIFRWRIRRKSEVKNKINTTSMKALAITWPFQHLFQTLRMGTSW